MHNTTYTAPAQARAKRSHPNHLNLPPAFDAMRWPILARHWFGIVPLFVPVTQERDDAGVEAEAA